MKLASLAAYMESCRSSNEPFCFITMYFVVEKVRKKTHFRLERRQCVPLLTCMALSMLTNVHTHDTHIHFVSLLEFEWRRRKTPIVMLLRFVHLHRCSVARRHTTDEHKTRYKVNSCSASITICLLYYKVRQSKAKEIIEIEFSFRFDFTCSSTHWNSCIMHGAQFTSKLKLCIHNQQFISDNLRTFD